MKWTNLIVAVSLSLACATAPAPPVNRPASGADRPFEEVLADVLPGVVLIVTQRPDGKWGYGSGVLRPGGQVLTSLHVVADAVSVGAMLYREDRTSYTPLDGGVARYLFENPNELIRARLVRGDPTLDLALIQLESPPQNVRLLVPRVERIRPGERVVALGHPKEAVWSFTSGMVSATPHAAIQHDAPINHGNSGGPLIDAAGRWVGINTFKIVGGADGLGYARPIDLALSFSESARRHDELDLSSPDKSVLSCSRAIESGSEEIGRCFDFRAQYPLILAAIHRLARTQPPHLRQDIISKLTAPGSPYHSEEVYSEFSRRALISFNRAQDLSKYFQERFEKFGAVDASMAAKMAAIEKNFAALGKQVEERTGLKFDFRNPGAQLQVLKMGVRVDDVRSTGNDRAWVRMRGRNLDATEYSSAVLMVREAGEWRMRITASADEEATRPSDWPLTSFSQEMAQELWIQGFQLGLQMRQERGGSAKSIR